MANPIAKLLSGTVGEVIGAIGGLIDKVSTTEEEKLEARYRLLELQSSLYAEALKADTEITKARAEVVKTEAASTSWLTANWRPLTMLVFTFIVTYNYILAPLFALQYLELTAEMWNLLQLGIGGYVVGRSVEKIIPSAAAAVGEVIAAKKS